MSASVSVVLIARYYSITHGIMSHRGTVISLQVGVLVRAGRAEQLARAFLAPQKNAAVRDIRIPPSAHTSAPQLVRTRGVRPTDQLAARAGDDNGGGGEGQRRRMAIFLAPPEELPALAPLGHYLLFLVGRDRSYSKGAWVQLVE